MARLDGWFVRLLLLVAIAGGVLPVTVAAVPAGGHTPSPAQPALAAGDPFAGPAPRGRPVPLWRSTVFGSDGAAVANGTIYLPEENRLSAVELISGTTIWRVETGTIYDRPLVGGGVVVAAVGEGEIRAYDAATGGEVWPASADWSGRAAAIAGESLILLLGGEAPAVVAVTLAGGDEVWRVETGDVVALAGVVADAIFSQHRDGTFLALDPATGVELWRAEGVEQAEITSEAVITVAGGTVAARAGATGEVRWEYQTEGAVLGAVAADALYLNTGEGASAAVIALNLASGAERWRLDGEALKVEAANGEHVYLTAENGDLVARAVAGGEEVWRKAIDGLLGVAAVDDALFISILQFDVWSGVAVLDAASGDERGRLPTGEFVEVDAVIDGIVVLHDQESGFWVYAGADDPVLPPVAAAAPSLAAGENPGWGGRPFAGPGPASQPAIVWEAQATAATAVGEVIGGVIYAALLLPGGASELAALDLATGETQWRVELPQFVSHVLASADGAVYAGAFDPVTLGDGLLLAVDGTTGAERWRVDLPEGTPHTLLAGPDLLLVAVAPALGGPRLVIALDSATGRERWRVEPAEAAYLGGLSGDTLYLACPALRDDGCENTTLAALDLATGQERWSFAAESRVTLAGTSEGILCLDLGDGSLVGLEAASGDEAWRIEAEAALEIGAVAGGVIYAAGAEGEVVALAVATGDEIWRLVGGEVEFVTAYAGDTLFATGSDRSPSSSSAEQSAIYAINTATGRERWRFPLEGAETVAAVVDGVAYAWNGALELVAIDARTATELWRIPVPSANPEVIQIRAIAGETIVAVGESGTLVALASAD